MPREKATVYYFAKMALVNFALFLLIYPTANHIAVSFGHMQELYFAWEKNIPLVDWMIVPYMSLYLMPLFPLFLNSREEMRVLGIALAFCTIAAGVLFFLYPLHVGFERVVPQGLFAPLYRGLFAIDMPANLAPSLHVAYAMLYYMSCVNTLRAKAAKILFGLLIATTIASTVLTHQHHLVDVCSGALLAVVAYLLVKRRLFPDGYRYQGSATELSQNSDASLSTN